MIKWKYTKKDVYWKHKSQKCMGLAEAKKKGYSDDDWEVYLWYIEFGTLDGFSVK